MDRTFVFKIQGMDCDNCAKTITIALEDAGFHHAVVDQDKNELVIPKNYMENLNDIKKVIDQAGHYMLVI